MALGRGQMGGGHLGARGVPRHVHTHAHTCIHIRHDNFMQMAFPIPRNSL